MPAVTPRFRDLREAIRPVQPQIAKTPAALTSAIADAASVGFVPTMGALHAGHLSLIQRSARENHSTVVSIFVNPTQFNDPGELATYPRQLDHDLSLATTAGATIIYTPSVEAIYPDGFSTTIHVSGVTDLWEGADRPGHFDGVATVVTILLNQVQPHRAYFGEKDLQQLATVRQMQQDLALPVEIIGCPTVRDEDGLALSSRNAQLTHHERDIARAVPRALWAMQKSGCNDSAALISAGLHILDQTPGLTVEYLAIVDPDTLQPLESRRPGARAIVAVTIGQTRLIDNIEL